MNIHESIASLWLLAALAIGHAAEPTDIVFTADIDEEAAREETTTPDLDSTRPIVEVSTPIVVQNLAEALGMKPFRLIKELMNFNLFTKATDHIEESVARTICHNRNVELVLKSKR